MSEQSDLVEQYGRIEEFHLDENLGRPLRVFTLGGGSRDAFFGAAAWFPVLGSHPMFQLVGGVPTTNLFRSKDFAARHFLDPTRIYETVDEMIDVEGNNEFGADLALICTPTAEHAKDAIKLAEAGIPMICEKPMTSNASLARRLVDIAYGNDTRIAVAYTQTTSPMALQAREISRGRIEDIGDPGKLTNATLTYKQAWMREHRTPEVGGYKQEMCRTKPDKTGDSNVTADLGTHSLDYLLSVGQGGRIKRMDANIGSTTGRPVDDSSIITLELTNGAYVIINSNNAWQNRKNEGDFDIAYENLSTRFRTEDSDELVVEVGGRPTATYFNGGGGLADVVNKACFMPAGHEGSHYHPKLLNIALALGEAVIADKLELDPKCLRRGYRTAIDGLLGVQFVDMAVNGNGRGWVENPFNGANNTLPYDNQKIGIFKEA
jgi:predicted dehydrogenase